MTGFLAGKMETILPTSQSQCDVQGTGKECTEQLSCRLVHSESSVTVAVWLPSFHRLPLEKIFPLRPATKLKKQKVPPQINPACFF